MKRILLITIITFTGLNLSAQILKDVSETQAVSKKVAELFKENKISDAFEELVAYWPMPQNELQELEEKTIKYMNILSERFGKTVGAVKIKNKTIGDFAIREVYVVRYEKSAIRLIFIYFKNDKGWIVNAFKWDDSFSEEFDE